MTSKLNAKKQLVRNYTDWGKKLVIDLVLAFKSKIENMKLFRFVSSLYYFIICNDMFFKTVYLHNAVKYWHLKF